MGPYKFKVEVIGFEPMSGSIGKGKRLVKKKELVDKIASKAGEEIQIARAALLQKRVHVRAEFYLWKGGEGYTNTTSKKDLDNLLKLVFDVLQPYVDSQHTTTGLRVIETDEDVFYAEAIKKIVDEREKAGLRLEVSLYRD